MRRIAAAETRITSALLAERRKYVKNLQGLNRKESLTSALASIVEAICASGEYPTRRLIDRKLRLAGFSTRRNEYQWLKSIRDSVIKRRA